MAVALPRPVVAHRFPEGLRTSTMKIGLLDRTDGSARFGFGENEALASVSGPIEVRLANEHASKATFEVVVRPLASVPGTEAKSVAAAIRSLLVPSLILTQNPRTLIQLVIQVLSSPTRSLHIPSKRRVFDAGTVAAMINASTLALMDSGVPMRGVVCAVAVARLPSSSSSKRHLVLDPTEDQSRCSTASGCFGFLFAAGTDDGEMSEVWTNWRGGGGIEEEEIWEAREVARDGAREVRKKMRLVYSS